MRRRPAVIALLSVLLSLFATVTAPQQAVASGCDKATALSNYGPDSGTIYAHKLSGNRYSASLGFELTQQQINNLICLGGWVEIDFHMYDSGLPNDWSEYAVFSDIPGAMHDTGAQDYEPSPAVTRIAAAQITADQPHFAGITWVRAGMPTSLRVSVSWTPQYWAGHREEGYYFDKPYEVAICDVALAHGWGYKEAFCLFGQKKLNGKDDAGYSISEASVGQLKLAFGPIFTCHSFGNWTCSGPPMDENGNVQSGGSISPAEYDPPPIPTIKSVKRRTDHAGIYQVYAATKSAVTEGWWRPGELIHTKEMIHISQGNIVGIDKVNEPDGTTQSLYTAVPDGVWETWWRPGDGPHSNKIVTGLSGVRQVIADPVTDGGQYTHRLYLLASDGPYEVWWRDGGDGIHVKRLDIVNDPVTMTKSRGPDGTDQLYVATPTYVYELWWRPDTAVNHGSVINITQGDIRSLDKGANLPDGGQLLYTGTSTTGWQTYWNGSTGVGLTNGTITVGQTNAGQVKKTIYDGVHQLYQTNGCRVQETWWSGPSSGSSTLIDISQCNITSFDKSADGPDQQVYTASGDLVYETWWRGGSNPSGPNTTVLFKVGR